MPLRTALSQEENCPGSRCVKQNAVPDKAEPRWMLFRTALRQCEWCPVQCCFTVNSVPDSAVSRWVMSRTVLFTVNAVPACAVSRCVMSRTVLFTVNAVLDSAVSKYSKWCTEQQCFKVSDVPDCALARLMFYGTRLCQGKYCPGQHCANVSAVLDRNGV